MRAESEVFETSSDDDAEERAANFGFTKDEIEELWCQGVKPWDEDAWVVLSALSDFDS